MLSSKQPHKIYPSVVNNWGEVLRMDITREVLQGVLRLSFGNVDFARVVVSRGNIAGLKFFDIRVETNKSGA